MLAGPPRRDGGVPNAGGRTGGRTHGVLVHDVPGPWDAQRTIRGAARVAQARVRKHRGPGSRSALGWVTVCQESRRRAPARATLRRIGDENAVTWRRQGHSCVVSGGDGVSLATVAELAGWKAKGEVPFWPAWRYRLAGKGQQRGATAVSATALGMGRRFLEVNRERAAGAFAHPLFELVQQGRMAVRDVAALAGVPSEVVQPSAPAAVGGHVCPPLAA